MVPRTSAWIYCPQLPSSPTTCAKTGHTAQVFATQANIHGDLSGQAIRTPTFRRFARISSQNKMPIFEALGQIRTNRVFSPIRIAIRVIRVQSRCYPLSGRSIRKKTAFSSENRFAENIFAIRVRRESIRANRPTKTVMMHRQNLQKLGRQIGEIFDMPPTA